MDYFPGHALADKTGVSSEEDSEVEMGLEEEGGSGGDAEEEEQEVQSSLGVDGGVCLAILV